MNKKNGSWLCEYEAQSTAKERRRAIAMNNQLTARILKHMPEFSKGQRLIAKYILEHYDKVAYMTASRLGATVGVSESTVVRFATEIGYTGYPELQQAMQEMIRSRLTSVQRIEVTANNMGKADVLSSVMNQDIDMIRKTLEETDRDSFYAAVNALAESRKIYIIGARSSLALATFLAYYFGLIFENVQLIDSSGEPEIFEKMIRVNEQDAVIGISFPRYSRRAVKAMHFASDRGAKVVAITDSPLSPLATYAEFVLLARSDMASFVDALVAPLSLINALIVMVTLKKQEEVTNVLHRLENIWDEYKVYEKVDDKESDSEK